MAFEQWLKDNRTNPFNQGQEQVTFQVFQAIVGRQAEESEVQFLRQNVVGKTIAEMEQLVKNLPQARLAMFRQYSPAEIEKRMPRVEVISDEELSNVPVEQLQKVFPNIPNITQLVQQDPSRWSREIRTGLERVSAGEILKRIGETPDVFTPQTRQAYQAFAENPLSFPIDTGRPAGQSGAVLGRPVFGAGVPQIPQTVSSSPPPPPLVVSSPPPQTKKATLTSPDNAFKTVVVVGSPEASQLQSQGWTLGDKGKKTIAVAEAVKQVTLIEEQKQREETGFAAQPAAQRQRATLINHQTGDRKAVDVGSEEAQQLFEQGYVLEKAGEAPPKPATVVMPSGERVQVNVPDKAGKVTTPEEAFAQGAVLEEKPPDVKATLVKEGEKPKVIETAEEAQKAFAEGFQLPEVTNLFQRDAEGNEGTIVKPPDVPKIGEPGAPTGPTWPVDTAPPEKKPEEKAPAEKAPEAAPPATGEQPPATAPAPTVPETPPQPSTQTIVDGMLAGVDASVKKLITEMTEKFGNTIAAWQQGQQVNEEELNKQFEELKTKNINPYFKTLITNYQTDLLHNLGALTGQRAIELEGQKTEFENQTRQARATLEASGLSFSGEALRLLGAGAAFGQRQLPPGMEQRAAEPLQMEEIPEGQVPQSQRLMATSTRARQAERLRALTLGAERELGSANIPAALKLAGFGVQEGEPIAGEFLAGDQIGDVERQKREAELAGLEALRGVQSATGKVSALSQPL